MNHNDRRVLGELKEGIKRTYQDIVEIKKDIKFLVKGHYKQEEKMTAVSVSMNNHLKTHDRNFKMFIAGLGAVGVLVGIIVAMVKIGVI